MGVAMRVYPFGYSVPDASARLDALMQDEKMVLVDTRDTPQSKWFPQFNRQALARRYKARYMWLGETLGNVNHKIPNAPIKLADAGAGITRLVTGLEKGYSIILLCACKNYEQCHRKVICEMLKIALPAIEVIQPDTLATIPDGSLPCISIKQPWTWLITSGLKDIENREWTTQYRGPLLLHAGSKADMDWFYPARHPKAKQLRLYESERMGVEDVMPNHIDEYPRGSIVGVCDLVDVVTRSESKWFCGKYGFVLANARPIEPIPYRGALKLFPVPRSVVQDFECAK